MTIQAVGRTKTQLSKHANVSQSIDKNHSSPTNVNNFRPFSASAGGGTYAVNNRMQVLVDQTSHANIVEKRLKKSNTRLTPKIMQE